MKTSILLIEDEISIADNISYSLQSEGFKVIWEALGESGLHRLENEPIDLIILDVGLPDINGFELCKKIRSVSSLPVIFLTARSEEIDRVVGLEIGADDYVTKPFSPRELSARVKAVLRRTRIIPDNNKPDYAEFEIDEAARTVHFKRQLLPLTPYEFGILKLLIQHPGRIYSREQLMNRVWPSPEESFDRVVDTHIKTLRSKLREVKADTDLIVTHRGLGYSFKQAFESV